ncbi:MAG: YncE family protein [Gemmatimonadetes bacterium]|nr:YncE family protein [Gemmatimonadota bacterium]
MTARRSVAGVALAAALAATPSTAEAQATYWAYVANESSDIVSLIRFDGETVVEEKAIDVGFHPADLDGAHGIRVSPTGQHWYVSIAHGQPYGQVWKMQTGSDQLVDTAMVGLFPATMATTPDGASLFVVNFNLHGDPIPSSVSAVFTPFMSEVSQIETCVMPHGSRVSADGTRHYSTCMMSDQLVEASVSGFRVERRMMLTAGHEGPMAMEHAGHAMGAAGGAADARGSDGAMDTPGRTSMDMSSPGICKPTWVVLSPDDTRIYVPCNGRGDVLEIDAGSMEVLRRFDVGGAPYNADITPDGSTLVVTRKGAASVAIIDLTTGDHDVVETTQSVTHGVAVTPDGRYAFVTNEAVGATRGTVDVIDLATGKLAASTALHYQPGGLDVWKMETPGA